MSESNKKFKLGDLVVNQFPLELDIEECKIKVGEVGLVIGEPQYADLINNFSGYDYTVLIKGMEVAYFEDELKLYDKKKDEKK